MHDEGSELEAYVEISDDSGKTWDRAEEYKVEETDKELKCYIEAKSGARFRFVFILPQDRESDLRALFFADSLLVKTRFVSKHARPVSPVKVEDVLATNNSVLPFKFDLVSLSTLI